MLSDDDVLAINADGPERLLSRLGRDSGVGSPCWPAARVGECCIPVTDLENVQSMLTSNLM